MFQNLFIIFLIFFASNIKSSELVFPKSEQFDHNAYFKELKSITHVPNLGDVWTIRDHTTFSLIYEQLQLMKNCLLLMISKKKRLNSYDNYTNDCGYNSSEVDIEESDSDYNSDDITAPDIKNKKKHLKLLKLRYEEWHAEMQPYILNLDFDNQKIICFNYLVNLIKTQKIIVSKLIIHIDTIEKILKTELKEELKDKYLIYKNKLLLHKNVFYPRFIKLLEDIQRPILDVGHNLPD